MIIITILADHSARSVSIVTAPLRRCWQFAVRIRRSPRTIQQHAFLPRNHQQSHQHFRSPRQLTRRRKTRPKYHRNHVIAMANVLINTQNNGKLASVFLITYNDTSKVSSLAWGLKTTQSCMNTANKVVSRLQAVNIWLLSNCWLIKAQKLHYYY